MPAKRRAAGDGSWRQRERVTPAGTVVRDWVLYVSLGFDRLTGKRIRRVFYGATQTEARNKYLKAKSNARGGKLKATDPTTVEQYLEHWLDEVERSKSSRTRKFYGGRIYRYALPPDPKPGEPKHSSLAKIKLEDLSNEHISTLYAELYERGVSADNVNKLHKTLSRAFNVAIGKGLVRSNPCAFVARKPHRPEKRIALRAEQIGPLLTAAETSPFLAYYRLGIFAAMRPGELFALQWPDFDFERAIVNVQWSLEEDDGPRKLVPAKADSARTIPLDAETVRVLQELHEAKKSEKHGSPFIFVTKEGRWVPPKIVRADLARICAEAKLPKLTPYNLRHTGVSLFGEAGVAIRVASDIAGHADTQITTDIYSHATDDMRREAVERAVALVKRSEKVA